MRIKTNLEQEFQSLLIRLEDVGIFKKYQEYKTVTHHKIPCHEKTIYFKIPKTNFGLICFLHQRTGFFWVRCYEDGKYTYCKFQIVLEEVPLDIKKKLLYHLNIFTKYK